jgi:hypothetical protein
VLLGADEVNEVVMVADAGNNRLQSVSGNVICSIVTNMLIPTAGNVLGTPTTDGASLNSNIYVPAGGSDIANLSWDTTAKTFSMVGHTSINVVKTIAPVAIAGDLFLPITGALNITGTRGCSVPSGGRLTA